MPPAYFLPGQAYQVRHDEIDLFNCQVNLSKDLKIDVKFSKSTQSQAVSP
jgi:hypothetical protein